MDRTTITRIAGVVIVGATLATMAVFTPVFAAEAKDFTTKAFASVGIPEDGFYTFAFSKITETMQQMDEAMQGVGFDHNLADLFTDTANEVIEDFADVTNEEEAFDKLEEYINTLE